MVYFMPPDIPAIVEPQDVSTLPAFISRLVAAFPEVKILLADDVTTPEASDDWISIGLQQGGDVVEIVVFSVDRFYACLGKVIHETMPDGRPVH